MPERSPSRWRALGALLRPDALRWALLGALIAASSAGAIAGPLVVREVVDAATEGTTAGEIARLGLLFLAIAVVTQVIGVIVVRRATKLAWGITNELRLDITRHVLGLDHEFHRRHTPGELIQRVDGDVTNVSDFLSQVVPKVFGAIMLVTGVLTVLFVLDWRLGVGMVVYLGIGAALLRQPASSRRQRVLRRDERLRPPLRRHRGEAHGDRGPALQRRRGARDVALRRGLLGGARQLGAPRSARSCGCGGR